MRIGVIGAAGRLGSMMIRTLAGHDGVEAVDAGATPAHLDAVINAAPLRDAAVHRQALDAGCHVIDVTIDRGLIAALLALDPLAKRQQRCLIAMAGLSPGLTGVLARDLLARAAAADHVQVSLLQSRSGTAGEHGTREMIDLLTRPECRFESRPWAARDGRSTVTRGLFDLDGPELVFLPQAARMRLVTGFDSRLLNGVVRALARVRRVAPAVYRGLRDRLASRKARADEAAVETVELGALALTREGRVLAGRRLRLASDYGATAAIAAAAALRAVHGLAPRGAGHLADFVGLDALLADPLVRRQIIAD